MVPVTVDGEQVKLAVITHKPAGDGPFPTLVFHHGSTGRGNNSAIFAYPYDPSVLARWFTARGWAVLLPSRRGRGGSRGGILSIAWSGRQPATPRAVINFVGGWTGARCPTASANNQNLFMRGAAFGQPTIWLYGEGDPFYPLSYSRSNFAAFQTAGGKGTFHEFSRRTA